MIKYINYNTIDFIEYREMKKGIDLNLYLTLDLYSLFRIHNEASTELESIFNELIDVDKKLTSLKRKSHLNQEDNKDISCYTNLGQLKYDRYIFLEEKIEILNKAIGIHKENNPN